MDFFKLVSMARTCRRFKKDSLSPDTLDWLIDCARLAPNGGNAQVLRYAVVATPQGCSALFPLLKWAGYLHDWAGPEPRERPTGYIVILSNAGKRGQLTAIDTGIAAQTIQLAAATKNIGCCMIISFNPDAMRQVLDLPEGYTPLLVLALGMEKEVRCIDPIPANGSIKYWRDEQGVHHIPKRSLEDVIITRK